MFTGIIESVGRIASNQARDGDVRLGIDSADLGLDDVRIGDSIAVNGVCLTVIERDGAHWFADVSVETLDATTLGDLRAGAAVNLEKAMRLSDRLGGHLVAGHVDGVGGVLAIEGDARSQRWWFEIPAPLARYVAAKGSICIDGVSLTVNTIEANRVGVNLIPHTIEHTAFRERAVGDRVNIEVDLIARHVERLLGATPTAHAAHAVVPDDDHA